MENGFCRERGIALVSVFTIENITKYSALVFMGRGERFIVREERYLYQAGVGGTFGENSRL